MRAFDPFSVEDGEDVADALVERVGGGAARRCGPGRGDRGETRR